MQWLNKLVQTVVAFAHKHQGAATRLILATVGIIGGYHLTAYLTVFITPYSVSYVGGWTIMAAALSIFAHFTLEKILGQYQFWKVGDSIVRKTIGALWLPVTMGGIMWVVNTALHSTMVAMFFNGIDSVLLGGRDYLAGKPIANGPMGWTLLLSVLTLAILGCTVAFKHFGGKTLKFPLFDRFENGAVEVSLQAVSLWKVLAAVAAIGFIASLGAQFGVQAFALAIILYSVKGVLMVLGASVVYMVWKRLSLREAFAKIPRKLVYAAIASVPAAGIFYQFYDMLPANVYQFYFDWGPWFSLAVFGLTLGWANYKVLKPTIANFLSQFNVPVTLAVIGVLGLLTGYDWYQGGDTWWFAAGWIVFFGGVFLFIAAGFSLLHLVLGILPNPKVPTLQRFALPKVIFTTYEWPLDKYSHVSPKTFKWLSAAWLLVMLVVAIHVFGFTAILPQLEPLLPWFRTAIKFALLLYPLYYFGKRFVLPQQAERNQTFVWFSQLCKPHWTGVDSVKSWAYFVVIGIFLWVVVELNSSLQDSYANMTNTAISKDPVATYKAMWEMALVFGFAMVFMPFNSWIRRRAFFQWRKGLVDYVLGLYLSAMRKYLKIAGREDVDNPDERIHEDIMEFTNRTYNLVLSVSDALLTLSVFSYKLYGMSVALSVAAICYALLGTVVIFQFTKKMVAFMIAEKRLEANFRYYLIFVRIMAEPIAFFRGHLSEKAEIERRFARIMDNFNKLNAWQRNLEHFTKGYSYADMFVIMWIMLPLYFAGQIKWGDLQGAQMAFSMVLGSLSLAVNEFVTWSRLVAVTKRLGHFHEVLTEPDYDPNQSQVTTIEVVDSRELKFDNVTIVTPRHSNKLVEGLNVCISPTSSTIFVGPSGSGKTSALRIGGGLWKNGSGSVSRPPLEDFMFLPQRPLLNVGTLRNQLLYPFLDTKISDGDLQEMLSEVGLPKLIERFPQGLDTLQEYISWGDVLSPGEQQRVSFVRVLVHKPKIVILDEATAALDVRNEKRLYEKLKKLGVTYASVGHRPNLVHYHDQVVEFLGDGTFGWRIMTPAEYEAKQKELAAQAE